MTPLVGVRRVPGMGYSLSGWVEFVVTVEWMVDDSADFGRFGTGLQDNPMSMCLTMLPSAVGAEPLGAMVEDQTMNAHYVRFAGPAHLVGPSMEFLRELAADCFPRIH